MPDFKGRPFEGEIVLWAVQWNCRYGACGVWPYVRKSGYACRDLFKHRAISKTLGPWSPING